MHVSRNLSAKERAFRDQPVARSDFKCACGCALQLSRGDLQDAMAAAARIGGAPRTWGVDISPRASSSAEKRESPEPVVGRPCSKCGDMVYVPDYAAKLLDERKGMWPFCADCQKTKDQTVRNGREYWE
jgi:hypothetical protein